LKQGSKTKRIITARKAIMKYMAEYAGHAYDWDMMKEGDIDCVEDFIDETLEKLL
jgi:hypothetical protein